MKTLQISLKGASPLIMHSCRGVNPLDPLSMKLKELTGKRKKTEEDLRKISDLEWELSLYWDDEIGLYIPAENIERCVQDGATARRKGKDIVRGFNCLDLMNPLDIMEDISLGDMRKDMRFRDVRPMKVKMARVMRTRARFNMWKVDFRASYDEALLDLDTVASALEYAGKYCGLCDSRPKYGAFVASITELD